MSLTSIPIGVTSGLASKAWGPSKNLLTQKIQFEFLDFLQSVLTSPFIAYCKKDKTLQGEV